MTAKQLNERFYKHAPDEHFRRRLFNLLVTVERPEAIQRTLVEEPLVYGGNTLVAAGGETESVRTIDDNPEALRRFMTAEMELLFHHAGESLLRLYLGHREAPSCPWYEITRLFAPGKFKDLLRSEIVADENDDLRAGIRCVFLADLNLGESEADAVEAYADLLRRVSQYILDNSNLYNSVKHGFAIAPTNASVFFAEKDPREANNRDDWIKLGEGRSIDYLEWENIDSGRLWKLTTTWIDAPRLAPVIDAICVAMSNLWDVARRRYLGEKSIGRHILGSSFYDALPERSVGNLERISINLGIQLR